MNINHLHLSFATNTATIESSRRVPQLDGIRGFAILSVLGWHLFGDANVLGTNPNLIFVPSLLRLAWGGVDLFFCLSGFLIVGILVDQKGANNYYRAFYVRRFARILPLYLMLLCAYHLLNALSAGLPPVIAEGMVNDIPAASYWFLVQNLYMGKLSSFGTLFLSPTWSLAVEEQFYLVLPFLVCVCSRRQLLAIFIMALLFAPCLRHFRPSLNGYVNSIWRMDSVMSGGLMAIIIRSTMREWLSNNRGKFLITLSLSYCGLLVLFLMTSNMGGSLVHSVLTLASAFTIGYVTLFPQSLFGNILGLRALRFFGSISFGLYLLHQPVNFLMHGFLLSSPPSVASTNSFLVTLISLGLTAVLSVLSQRFLEGPIIKWSHQVKYVRQ